MALIVADRVRETTTTVGTGAFALGGAQAGFQAFSAVLTNGDTTYYACAGTTDWEVGVGTWNTGNTLSRTTVLASSNGGSAVNFSAGSKDIFISYPAGRSVYRNEAGTSTVQQAFSSLSATSANITTATITSGTVSTTPSSGNDIANKTYVDTTISSGITYHSPVKYEVPNTTGNLNAIYNQPGGPGVGVGATLTNNGTLAAFAPDGPTASPGDRILIYNQTNAFQNGVYTVTTVGSGSVAWVLTRATDADTYALKSPTGLGLGDAFFVTSGNSGAGETYVCNTSGTITFGTTSINFVQVSSAQIYSAGTGLTLSGTQFSITNTGVGAATYGSASAVPVIGVNAQGQITSATNTTIAITGAQVSGNIAGSAGSVANALTAGSYLTSGGTFDGSVARTFAVDATTTNTASKVVARDASGNFSAGTITASLSGNATSANTSTNISGGTANQIPYQASAGTTTFVAAPTVANTILGWTGSAYTWTNNITGNAATATTATNWGSYGAVPAAGTSFGNANTIGRSDANGYTYFNYINSNTGNSENPTVSQVIVTNGGDNFYRKASVAHLTSSLSGTAPINISGSAVNLSTTRSNWSTNGTITAVVGQLAWKNYGNSHTIFDASASTSPDGTAVNNTNSAIAWTGSYPTLMGWNGSTTYGVRVDSARVADSAGAVDFNNLTNKTGGTGTYTTSGDYRAPIFYDSNNTAYYGDFASNSVVNTIYARNAAATNWKALYSSNYGYSTSYGALVIGDTSGLLTPCINVDPIANASGSFNGGGVEVMFRNGVYFISPNSANNSYNQYLRMVDGYVQFTNSARAPIFYDSNDTSYYLDPASTSNLSVAQLLNGKWYPVNDGSGTSIDIYVRPDNNNTYVWRHIYGGTGTGYGTGVGGYGIYCNHLGGNYSLLFSPSGFVTAPYSFRAPIFYDSDNTAYYGDFASTSNLNVLAVQRAYAGYDAGVTGSFSCNNWFRSSGATGWYNESYTGGIWMTDSTWVRVYNSKNFLVSGGYGESDNSWRAPIFYDSNNTTYYLDFSAGGKLLGNFEVASDSNASTSYSTAAIELRETSYGSSSSWLAPRLGFHWGGVVASQISIETSGRITILNNPGTGYENLIGNILYGAASVRSPIFYDSDNTAYYVDPSIASNLSGTLTNNGGTAMTGGWNRNLLLASTFPVIVFNSNNTKYSGIGVDYSVTNGGFYFWVNGSSADVPGTGTVALSVNTGNYVTAFGSFRSPIFYDSDNTAYYVNPNSTSQLGYVLADNWFRPQGSTGVFWQDYSYYLYKNPDTYANLRLGENPQNSYVGIQYFYSSSRSTTMFDSGGNGGLYNYSYWIYYWNVGNACLGVRTSSTSSSYALYVDGGIYATGNITAYSDVRKKTNIVTVDNALRLVNKMRGVFYNRIDSYDQKIDTNKRQVGVIAQEVNEVLPEVVTYAKDVDEYGVQYGNLAGVFIEAIKELASKVAVLEAKLAEVK